MKKVLVITYSQSGQLKDIVSNIVKPMEGKVQIFREELKPVPDYPWPWPGMTFWDAMPECVRHTPSDLKPLTIDINQKYDLIILGYPIWFLSPPVPITTLLKSDAGKKLFKDTIVVTVIGARNMWVSAQEDIKKMISEAGGKLKGNIALCDRHQNLISVVTIVYWVSTAKKDRYLNIFPRPGISDEDIALSKRFSEPVLKAILEDQFDDLQNKLIDLHAADLTPSVVSLEKKGKKIFWIFSGFILKKGGPGSASRAGRLKLFKYYLLFVIFAVSPIATLIFYLTYPFYYFQIKRNLKYYKGVELK
jgi:hypothetical protein